MRWARRWAAMGSAGMATGDFAAVDHGHTADRRVSYRHSSRKRSRPGTTARMARCRRRLLGPSRQPPRRSDRVPFPDRGGVSLRLYSRHRMALMKTVLVVDDEPQIVQLVRDYLEHGGFEVLTAADGSSALRLASTQRPDLVILDLGLPGVDGLDVTRSLRRNGEVPIIMLTARTDESDKLVGLELGADDYVTKPFSPKELVARVRSVLRRSEAAKSPSELIRVGDVELDVASMRLSIEGRSIDLTQTEFQLLSTMARQPGRVFSRAQLLNAVHGVAFESYERAIDAHIKNLRRKIEPDPHNPRYLVTVLGVGYRVADLRR